MVFFAFFEEDAVNRQSLTERCAAASSPPELDFVSFVG